MQRGVEKGPWDPKVTPCCPGAIGERDEGRSSQHWQEAQWIRWSRDSLWFKSFIIEMQREREKVGERERERERENKEKRKRREERRQREGRERVRERSERSER